jgi:cathepsin L
MCGSCWSFASVGTVEGAYFLKTDKLVQLSEQQLVDCSTKFGNKGCHGGWMDNAYKYILKYGLESAKDYSYTAKEGKCHYDKSDVVTKISGYNDIAPRDEKTMAKACASKGPLAVAVSAGN